MSANLCLLCSRRRPRPGGAICYRCIVPWVARRPRYWPHIVATTLRALLGRSPP